MGTELYLKYFILAFTFPQIFILKEDEPQIHSPHQLYRHVTHDTLCCSIVWMQNTWTVASTYLRNDPEHCFSVALTDCTQTGPPRQPWQHHILEQPKMLSRIMGLLLQSCHPRGRVLTNKTGICLDMTKRGTPHPTAMEDDTGKVERTQRQVQWASE